jgi:superfamily I DNA/RNA helicase
VTFASFDSWQRRASRLAPYDAILVDEGQDLDDASYRSLVAALRPESNSLLICYDYAQNVYKRTVSWKKLGVEVQGKRPISFDVSTDNLEVNYRNTVEVIRFAARLWPGGIPTLGSDDEVRLLRSVGSTRASGPDPTPFVTASRSDEFAYAIDWVQARHREGVPLEDIAVLYPGNSRRCPVEKELLPGLRHAGLQPC